VPTRGNDAEVYSDNSREQLCKAHGHRACGEARERWRARRCSADSFACESDVTPRVTKTLTNVTKMPIKF
jgi:hypothetical protein